MKYERSVPQPEAERGIGTAGQSGRGTVGDCGTLGKHILLIFMRPTNCMQFISLVANQKFP